MSRMSRIIEEQSDVEEIENIKLETRLSKTKSTSPVKKDLVAQNVKN